MIEPARHRIIEHIVYQHAENASHLFLQRASAVDEPHYTKKDIAELDERIEANIDGLRIAGAEGYEIARGQLDANPEPGEFFVCSLLAIEARDKERFAPLLEIARADEDACLGLRGAIGWCLAARLKPWVQPWLDSADPFERYLAAVACSLHRADPGARLAGFLADADPLLRRRAARLVGELGRGDQRQALMPLLEGDRRAAWSLGLLGERAAIGPLQKLAAGGWNPALQVVVRLMHPDEARAWIRTLNGEPVHARTMVQALGLLGDPQAVPWLIGRMGDDAVARVAGESFSLITGIDLAYDDLDRDGPPLPDDDTLDAQGHEVDEDEDLPWPDADLCQERWQAIAAGFAAGQRHLCGLPVERCGELPPDGLFQRQRRALAYERQRAAIGSPLPDYRQR